MLNYTRLTKQDDFACLLVKLVFRDIHFCTVITSIPVMSMLVEYESF